MRTASVLKPQSSLDDQPLGGQWASVRVGDICDLKNGSSFRSSDWDTTGLPIIRIQNLNDRTKNFNYWNGSIEKVVSVKKGDVLLAWSGTPGTSFGAHIWDHCDGVLNQHIFRVDFTSDCITRDWFVRAVNFRLIELINRAHGAVGLAHVTKGEVQDLKIPLPPIAEQKRIAAQLTEQLAIVERARAAAAQRLADAEALPNAYLRNVFDQPTVKNAEQKKLRDFAQTRSGATPSRGEQRYFGGDIPWVKTGELKDGLIGDESPVDEYVTNDALAECSLPLLPPDTLLIAMYGQGQTRGRTGLLTVEATTNQACFAILPKPDVFDSRYLQFWFRANYDKLRAMTDARGGNQPNLNGVILRELEIPIPAVDVQRKIAEDATQRIKKSSQLIQSLRTERDGIAALPSALLRSAFENKYAAL